MSITPSRRSLETSIREEAPPGGDSSASTARFPILRLEWARRPRTMDDCSLGSSAYVSSVRWWVGGRAGGGHIECETGVGAGQSRLLAAPLRMSGS